MLRSILLILGLLFLQTCPLDAAVAFDARFSKGQTSGTSPFAFVSNAGTTTGTVGAGADRTLICLASFDSGSASHGTVTMTWNSVAMTAITNVAWNAGARQIYLFGLDNPDSGNLTISVAWTSASNTVYLGCVSMTGSEGWQNSGSDTGTGTSASSVVTSASGNMAVVGHGNNNASSTSIAAGTSAWIDDCCNTNAAQGYVASSGASSTVTWTLGSSVDWGNVKVDVIASGGGGGGSTGCQKMVLLGVGGSCAD